MTLYSYISLILIAVYWTSCAQNVPDELECDIPPLSLNFLFASSLRSPQDTFDEFESDVPSLLSLDTLVTSPSSCFQSAPDESECDLLPLASQYPANRPQLHLNPISHTPSKHSLLGLLATLLSLPASDRVSKRKISRNKGTDQSKRRKLCRTDRVQNISATSPQSSTGLLVTLTHCRAFKKSSNLIEQFVEKPFKCSICRKSFKMKGSMIAHMRVHSDKRSFKCSLCDKAFKAKGNLSRHMKEIHSGEKSFVCLTCNKAFKRNSALTRHIKSLSQRNSLNKV